MGKCAAPVDLVHLARHTLGDVALEREVLQLFVHQSHVYLTRLKGADSDRRWRDAAHTLKGAARGIGAFRVAAEAEKAESAGFDSGRTCSRTLAAIETELDAARIFIDKLLNSHRAA